SRTVASIDDAEIGRFAFLLRSGRAVLLPSYQGTYERRRTIPQGSSSERDLIVQQSKDFQRSLDYLETRADIARGRLGFFGISGGSQAGLIVLAEESRIRAAVLAEEGLPAMRRPPETDVINFAPHVRIPVLRLNGRYDFVFLASFHCFVFWKLRKRTSTSYCSTPDMRGRHGSTSKKASIGSTAI
ncbi:MAG: alpha/beta hydrolase family protein, partial [Bryobacteraceae bacterium]